MFVREISLNLKILYARITLTPFTTLYFLLAVITCIALSALQILTFTINTNAATVLKPIHDFANFGIPLIDKGRLELCPTLPSEGMASCVQVIDFRTNHVNHTLVLPGMPVPPSPFSNLSSACIVSLRWLDELLQDNEREDIVTLLFNIYLVALALITVIYESIPHLIAALLGHVMSAGWAVYRLTSSVTLMRRYETHIVPLACEGVDFSLGSAWAMNIRASIPLLIIHVVTLVAFSYLSFILFKAYRKVTFSRVGAAPRIHKVYKVVLVFLVCLQLASFFCLTSAVLWLSKVSQGVMSELSAYIWLYRAAFIINIVVHLPWLLLGWFSVQRECKVRFAVCITIGVVLVGISTALFSSSIYMYIFLTWPFFTTVTCTAYILLVATTVFSVICRLNFGKGLAEYLHVTRVLARTDFTPVCFSKKKEKKKRPKADDDDAKPVAVYVVDLPPPAYQGPAPKAPRTASWIFSAQNRSTVQVSFTPPLLSEMGPVPHRLAVNQPQKE